MAELNITGKFKAAELARMVNILEKMDEEDVRNLGKMCIQDLDEADATRTGWKAWYAKALKLAMQISETKTYPWPNASNVKFPLLTIAAMGFHARAYPAIVNGKNIVKVAVIGADDENQTRGARASRVSDHMSYQVLEQTNWEKVTDASLLSQAILGTTFKKFYFDPITRTRKVKLVHAENLVVDYYTTDLATSTCISELYSFTKNDIYERCARGVFKEPDFPQPAPGPQATDSPIDAVREKSQHISQPVETTYTDQVPFVEQYRWLDLDGDGYKEPYVVYVRRDTSMPYRLVARFYPDDIEMANGKVVRIKTEIPYVKKGFVPSPDGGFYDLGFGALLGPINESVDTAINQMFDAGHLKTLGGGFLGRGVRVKGGEVTIRMNGWVRVDSTGDDLRKNILPHQMPEPSDVLFKLMMFLIEYAQRIASANDVQMGENPGQNTPAETMRTMSENGKLIFNALFKREWNSTKEEFQKLYDLNRRYGFLSEEDQMVAKFFKIEAADYTGPAAGVYPAADPNVMSSQEKKEQAALVMATSQAAPGHDMYQVVKRMYEANGITDIEAIFPNPKGPNAVQSGPSPQMLQAQAKLQESETRSRAERVRAMTAQEKVGQMRLNYRIQVAQLLDKHAKTNAEIAKMAAEVQVLQAQVDDTQADAKRKSLEAEIKAFQVQNDAVIQAIEVLNNVLSTGGTDQEGKGEETTDANETGESEPGEGGMAGMAAPAANPGPAGSPAVAGAPG